MTLGYCTQGLSHVYIIYLRRATNFSRDVHTYGVARFAGSRWPTFFCSLSGIDEINKKWPPFLWQGSASDQLSGTGHPDPRNSLHSWTLDHKTRSSRQTHTAAFAWDVQFIRSILHSFLILLIREDLIVLFFFFFFFDSLSVFTSLWWIHTSEIDFPHNP